MTQLGEAFVPIRATLDKLDGDLAAARGKIDGAMAGIGRATQGLGKIALAGITTGLVAVGGAAVIVGSQLIGLGSDAEEMMGKFNVVFANTGDMVISRLDEFAAAAGRSQYELRGMAATFGDTLKPMGFTEAQAADMAVTLSILATDLGSFNNMPMDEALQRLQGTLIGSHENALAFGVIINENTLAAEMAANGWDTLTGAELEAAKVQARMNLLIKGTTDAQGDAIRTSGSWANQMRTLTSTVKDAATELGLKLLPAVTPILQKIGELAQNAIPALIAAFENYLLPVIVLVSDTLLGFVSNLQEGMSPLDAFIEAIWDIAPQPVLDALVTLRDEIIPGVMSAVTAIIDPIAEWIANNIQLSDVLIALGIAILSVVLPAIASVVMAALPIIAVFAALVAAVALVRTAWENNWGGIQEKTAVAWEWIKGIFAQLQEWVVNVLIPVVQDLYQRWVNEWWPAISQALNDAWNNVIKPALQALWDFVTQTLIPKIQELYNRWVTEWWPAISQALSDAWENVIKPALDALWKFITETLIPTVKDLYQKWTEDWWPAISTAIENAWTIIKAIWEEIGRWINDNIVPWIEFLHEKWVEEIFPAISEAVEKAWEVIEPITVSLKRAFETAMEGIKSAIEPVKSLWDAFTGAIQSFWDWISNKTFSFNISIPDLPAWAIPSSPIPLHTAWKNFAADMENMTIAPEMDMSLLEPMAMAMADDSGPISSVSYTSSTTVNTSADPLRVLRASRHLDALGAML
jgi:phage-related protein